jgi:single-stranded DNA-binding protein
MTSGILASLTGTLHYDPAVRHAKANGKPFTAVTIKYRDGDGLVAFAAGTAFTSAAQAALADLHEGDGVTVTGYMKLGVYTPKTGDQRPSVQMQIEGVLPLKAKPKASNDDTAKKSSKKDRVAPAATADATDPDLNDDLSVLWAG